MTSKVHIIRWVSDPYLALPAEPLIFTVCNWQHEPGEDWSASLSVRYHDHAEIAVELCIGREEVGDEVGYVAIVSGGGQEPFRHLFETLHGAMVTAETMATQFVRDRHRELASQAQHG